MKRNNNKKYEAQALAITMVILVVSSLIGISIYSRSMKDKGLVLEERASAEALEVSDLILDKLSAYPIDTVIGAIVASKNLGEFNYEEGIVLKDNDKENLGEITDLLQDLGALEIDSLSELINPLCPIVGTANEYQVTLKETDQDTYYEIKPGNVWSLPVKNLIKSEGCTLSLKLGVRGDTRAGFVLTYIYCRYDESGNVIDCKEVEGDDILNYCFSDDMARCNNEQNFMDDENWIKYDPNGEEGIPIEILGSGETTEESVEVGVVLGFGTGADGDCSFRPLGGFNINTDSCVGRTYADGVDFSVINDVPVGGSSLTLSTEPLGLAEGDEVFIANLQGTATDYLKVGEYESAIISSINGNTLMLEGSLKYGYNGVTQKIVVQRIPQYTNVTVNEGAVWTSNAWNGVKGGLLIFRATGTTSVNGNIDVSGKGYRGGNGGTASKGGESFVNPGGGDSGKKGTYGGGGATNNNRVVTYSDSFVVRGYYEGARGSHTGGGGGIGRLLHSGWLNGGEGGNGGSGGGGIIIFSNEISLSGKILSNGLSGGNGTSIYVSNHSSTGGGGGGGAGGSILLYSNVEITEDNIEKVGVAGGLKGGLTHLPGGSGGDGKLIVMSPSGSVQVLGVSEEYLLSEIRIKSIFGTIGVSYSLPSECISGLKMYQLRATANCSRVYRGKEIIVPEAKWHNTLFDYVLFNGEGSI